MGRTLHFHRGGKGLTHSQGAKIPQAARHGQKKKKEKKGEKKVKRTHRMRQYSVNHTATKGTVFRIYKKFLQFNNKSNPI